MHTFFLTFLCSFINSHLRPRLLYLKKQFQQKFLKRIKRIYKYSFYFVRLVGKKTKYSRLGDMELAGRGQNSKFGNLVNMQSDRVGYMDLALLFCIIIYRKCNFPINEPSSRLLVGKFVCQSVGWFVG